MNIWIPVIAALGGTLVGGLLTWGTEERRWRREVSIRWDDARRDAYARFLGASLQLSYRWTSFYSRRDVRSTVGDMRQLSQEFFAAAAELDLLTSNAVKEAADGVSTVVADIIGYATDVYTRTAFGRFPRPGGPERAELLDRLADRRKAFSAAVHDELGIPLH